MNAASWRLSELAVRMLFGGPLNRVRRSYGLAKVRSPWRSMLGQRPIVASEPALAPLPPDDATGARQTGAWFLPERDGLSPEVQAFLDAGPPPVYLGFGSMPDRDGARTGRLIFEAVRRAGVRAIVPRAWAGLDAPPCAGVLLAGAEPHGKLFPRCAAVVHHGGAGTIAQTMRAGLPHVVVPHLLDQFFWSHRLVQQGLAAGVIPRGRLRSELLAGAIRIAVEDEALRARARAFAARMVHDGVERAVELIEAMAREGARRP